MKEVLSIVQSGHFENLVGTVENDWFECKGAPYILANRNDKQEFAKDISGFANANGGIVLLGAETKINDMHRGEEIFRIRSFSESLVDIEQYFDVLKSWIYPSLYRIEIEWYASVEEPTRGIIAIHIPLQPGSRRPFLVNRFVEETARMNAVVFGYFERVRDNTDPTSVEEIHRLLRDGLHYDTLSANLGASEERIIKQSVDLSIEDTSDSSEITRERVEAAISAARLESRPAYVLTAVPTAAVAVSGLFESRSSPITQLLERPPEIRYGGFDITVGVHPQIVEGRLRRAVTEGRDLELWIDGTLIFIAPADRDFLSWGSYNPQSYLRINQIALIESAYLFVNLYKVLQPYLTPTPASTIFTIELRNMPTEPPVVLYPGAMGGYMFDANVAPDSKVLEEASTSGDWEPAEVAFDLVKRIYHWFGFDEDDIPYTEEVHGRRQISEQKLREITQ
ncbi:MAG: hypothetical protein P8Y39_08545 [Nitrospirota bacterium]